MFDILSDDNIRLIIKFCNNNNDILKIRIINHYFHNSVSKIHLNMRKLEYLLNNKKKVDNCVNEYCFWDSYLDIYDTDIYYHRYIHSHQYAINFVKSALSKKQIDNLIYIPYCFECMQKYKPILDIKMP